MCFVNKQPIHAELFKSHKIVLTAGVVQLLQFQFHTFLHLFQLLNAESVAAGCLHFNDPVYDFFQLLLKKVEVEIEWLEFKGTLKISALQQQAFIYDIAKYCNRLVEENMEKTRKVLKELSEKYKFVLVSNFYGNIHTVLKTYGIDQYFAEVVESSVVGVRKPDPKIWELGVERAGCKAEECVVVADNFNKDIAPAHSIGCRTIWLRGEGWQKAEEADMSIPDAVVGDLAEVLDLL